MQFARFSLSLSLSVGLSVSPTQSLSPSLGLSLSVILSLSFSLSHTPSLPKGRVAHTWAPDMSQVSFLGVTSRRLDPSRGIFLVLCHIFLRSIFLLVFSEKVSYREASAVSCLLKMPRIQGRCLKTSSSRYIIGLFCD